MVKSVLGVNHEGLRDWIMQRLSAIFMAVYSLGLITYFLFHRQLTYVEWHQLFSYTFIKVATLLFIVCILVHAWVGMWTVFTDYVKPFVLRSILNTLVLLALIAFFFWTLLILWSV